MHKKAWLLLVVLFVLPGSLASATDIRPIIGITPSFSQNQLKLNNDYILAVIENGAIPVVLPPIEDEEVIGRYLDMVDGMIFTGGPDIPPHFYLQDPHPTTKPMEKTRFEFEKQIIPAFYNTGKPIFGICLGMQFVNASLGGSMIQDIPDLVGNNVIHRDGQMYSNFHQIGIAMNSKLRAILATNATKVLSRHHQAVDRVGASLKPVAWSADGVIEALERVDGAFGLFVQWHPESMRQADRAHRDLLFRAFIDACKLVD